MSIKKFFNTYIIVIFFFFGCFFAGNQLLVNYVGRSFGASDIEFGYLVGAMYVGSLSMVLVFGEISERIGKRMGVVIAAVFYSSGALFVALAGSVDFSILAFFLFGIGTGGIEGILFSLIGDYNGPHTNKIMNISQAVFSIGAVSGPLMISWIIKFVNYKYIYGIIWAFMGILAILFFLSKEIDTFAIKAPKEKGALKALKLIRNPAMVIFMLTLMIAIGCETAVTYWLIKYYDLLGVVGLGAIGISVYWVSSIPGRMIGAYSKDQGRYLSLSFILGSAGIILLLILPTPALKFIGIVLLGIALAPVYPCISTLGAGLFPEKSAAAFSLMVFSCGIGGALAQPLIGAISEASSITTVYGAIAVIMLILSVMIFIGAKLAKKSKKSILAYDAK